MLAAFHMLLQVNRLFGAPEQNLPSLLAESRLYQETVSTQLAEQVLAALHALLRGFVTADARTDRAQIVQLAQQDPEHLYSGLLTALLRMVFILYAEDRDLFPRDAVWEQGYSLAGLFTRLRDDSAIYPDTMDDRYGAWAQLIALWRLVHSGGQHGALRLVARQGRLFDPGRFPFLEGRTSHLDDVCVPAVSDGVVWRVLNGLMLLGGERLSYRTLDVEQIGSVYQAVMGFSVELTEGRSVAILAPKRGGASATINLEALLAEAPARRPEWISKRTDRKVNQKVATALKDGSSILELEIALSSVIDERVTPKPIESGIPVLQPTESRRRTGSHFTPRHLTAPIVAESLRPVLERLGPNATSEQILELKVLDPAVGSGAFLVEACRQLSERVTHAWEQHGNAPVFPPDEDALLHARRLVAQRCLYGVDRNAMAADLAKLSLWLVTLARDHEFTFLDHAIRHGDSLVGLFRDEISRLNWESRGSPTFAAIMIDDSLALAEAERKHIRSAAEGAPENSLRQLLEQAGQCLADVNLIGDSLVGAFFSAGNPRERVTARSKIVGAIGLGDVGWQDRLRSTTRDFRPVATPLFQFHWEVQFPEVFLRENPGFDAIIGNPPFMGGTRISSAFGKTYFDWLLEIHKGSKNRCDLVAHFFRRSFNLLRLGGCFGLVATKTIAQGDTRESGLQAIVKAGGQIYTATKRLRWPGEAAVIVSVVHVAKGAREIDSRLNGKAVEAISCYLVEGTNNETPKRLSTPIYGSLGSKIYGQGFLFDDHDSKASPTSLMRSVLSIRPDLASRVIPYIGGEDLNSQPEPQPYRYAIYLSDIKLESELDAAKELAAIVREKVKPDRDRLGTDPNALSLKRKWWAYQAHRPGLYDRIADKSQVLCHASTSKHLAFTLLPVGMMFNQDIVVFDTERLSDFSVLQSRVHEVWARFFGLSLGDTFRYSVSDVFETFPLPANGHLTPLLEELGHDYFAYRSKMMIATGIGMTKTYNRFNDPSDQAPDIVELRELHDQLDRAVLKSYGWQDVVARPIFEAEWLEDDGEAPIRYRWPEETRDLVLARLLELNEQRAQDEMRRGLSTASQSLFPVDTEEIECDA